MSLIAAPSNQQTAQKIADIRQRLGSSLAILAHHYQSDAVVSHADFLGDSLELSRRIPDLPAKHIVFCGVHFMAETAAALAGEGQHVHLPDASAGCVMANMVPAELLTTVLDKLEAGGRRIIPLAYVNTSAAVKAVVGERGGAVCTSANAKQMLAWSLEQGDAVLFLPDRHLAQNAADQLGLPEDQRLQLNIRTGGADLDLKAAATATLLMWPGSCVIHYRFNTAQMQKILDTEPEARIIVHPECTPEVMALAHASGSTSGIIKYVAEAPEGARIYIGTEINLVNRLAKQYAGTKTILPLTETACSNMAKTTEDNLLALLKRIAAGTAEDVTVDPALAEPARLSIERMLKVGSK